MPSLACWNCGRRVYATAGLEALGADERRCPRCGVLMNLERRGPDRRETMRRQNSPDDPGPPDADERRAEERRKGQRRRSS
jgi:DNA-directed RNA polymerase subunit RPC12/RpoP